MSLVVRQKVGERGGTAIGTALRLARYFSNSPEFWLNLQGRYELDSFWLYGGKRSLL